MIKYKIIKNNVETNSWTSDFADETYYEPCFGKPQRWVRESECSQDEISASLESRLVEPEGDEAYSEYLLPADYEVTSEDITSQLVQDVRNAKLVEMRRIRDLKLSGADRMVNELVLEIRADTVAVKDYRAALLAVTDDYKYINEPNKAKVAIDSVDLEDSEFWPTEP